MGLFALLFVDAPRATCPCYYTKQLRQCQRVQIPGLLVWILVCQWNVHNSVFCFFFLFRHLDGSQMFYLQECSLQEFIIIEIGHLQLSFNELTAETQYSRLINTTVINMCFCSAYFLWNTQKFINDKKKKRKASAK